MQYEIKEINREEKKIYLNKGGWQMQREYGIGGTAAHGSSYFIENIFEELDVAEEWFLDEKTNTLYYYPSTETLLSEAKIEIPVVKDMIQLKGTKKSPVKNIHFKGFTFTQSSYTFMDSYEPVARGDWSIHRGGAVFMEGTENCLIEDCNFEYVGGNGVFMSSYNRNNKVTSCRFVHTGESAVCFVGSPSSVRFYLTWDDVELDGKNWLEMRKDIDLEPGPKTPDYPKNCVVENSVMHDFGDVGKQIAGVYISMSHKIKAAHNTIYNCPRAGICINDGTWGGHIIEFNDIWESVRETGEHGPFNSWGRERQWKAGKGRKGSFVKELTRLDAIDNVIIRNNRIANYRKSVSAGNWTIDLDDGSSYFEIYNNLNLGSTLKLRDGMGRKVYNNITVSAVPLGWHAWPDESEDEIYKNIFVIAGYVPGKGGPTQKFIRNVALPTKFKWSTNYDHNLYWNVNYPTDFHIIEDVNMKEWNEKGYDLNSVSADPNFVDAVNGNYQVKENSPALKLGFKNFPMDQFGHQMTRILPFGGDFSEESTVTLLADVNAGKKAKIYFTKDGSEPNEQSFKYSKPFIINKSTVVKARTFDSKGISVGFTAQAEFTKVEKVTYPNWLSTLIAGKFVGGASYKKGPLRREVLAATLVNIAEDPDLIDAKGGYNFGCYIKQIKKRGKIWTYEIQLLDCWNVKKPKFSDIGGIYQRWNKKAPKGKQGYEGHSPSINAAKAPGLWQHLKIKFTAPTFNKAGKKNKNAKFDEVWLNGVLLHKNIEVTGPTRAAAFDTETSMAPIMIQGDHGPVAFKNIKYKLYKKQNISFSDLNFKEYNTTYNMKIPNLHMVRDIKNKKVKSVSLAMLKSRSYSKTFYYTGKLSVPETGEYLFNFNLHSGGIGVLLINKDTISSNTIKLTKGEPVPFFPWLLVKQKLLLKVLNYLLKDLESKSNL